MPDKAPATQDQPTTPLDRILQAHGVPRSLPPELLQYARERDLVLEGEEEEADTGDTDAEPADTGDQPDDDTESFTDFDPSQIPDDADREWLAERYAQMQGDYSRKTMELGEGRRQAEESEALIEGLRDPETMPHYLRLMGVDLTDPETLSRLGIDTGDDFDDLDEELDPDDRVTQLEQRLAQRDQEDQAAAELQALDELADTELEAVEEKWGRKLDEDEDAFLRNHAENNPGRDGLPDYASAAKVLRGVLKRGVEQELERRKQPGRGGPGGKPGGKALDPNKDEDRLALAARAAEKAMASNT